MDFFVQKIHFFCVCILFSGRIVLAVHPRTGRESVNKLGVRERIY